MKRTLFFLFLLATLWGPGENLTAQESTAPSASHLPRLTTCTDKNLGFQIKCSPHWQREISPESLMLVVKGRPRHIVTVTITKFAQGQYLWEDLSPKNLQANFHYEPDFKIGPSRVGGQKAVIVIANPIHYPNVQILDYFVIKNKALYRISFSVNTRNRFEEYKDLFAVLIRSFTFTEPSSTSLSRVDAQE